jgi:hypothetical protein
MVMKAGASNHDKVRIRKMHNSLGYSPEQISALTRVRPKHVAAIIKQINAGTLKVGGTGGREYNHGDQDGQEEQIEAGAAKLITDDAKDLEIQELQAVIDAEAKRKKKKAKKKAKRAKKLAKLAAAAAVDGDETAKPAVAEVPIETEGLAAGVDPEQAALDIEMGRTETPVVDEIPVRKVPPKAVAKKAPAKRAAAKGG